MGMTFGGLQKKMVRLVMLVLCLAIGALTVVSFFQDKMLIRLVEDTRIEQQQAISGISKETMSQVLEDSFVRMTGVEAENADHEFSEVVTDITILQSMAEELLKNRDSVAPVMIGGPDISKDGTASAFALSENGVDYTKSELLGAVAHMSSTMIAMLNSSEKITERILLLTTQLQISWMRKGIRYLLLYGKDHGTEGLWKMGEFILPASYVMHLTARCV